MAVSEKDDDLTVLIVDDDRAYRVVATLMLEHAGYSVVSLGDCDKGLLELIRLHDVCLVLLDVVMPDVDGLEVLKILRGEYSAGELPVVMLSATDRDPMVVEALESGANDYVCKLVDPSVLLARVGAHIRLCQNRERGIPKYYRLEEKVGEGSMGTVMRAFDTRLSRKVAVKILKSSSSRREDKGRFRREASALASFEHPNVVEIFDFGTEPDYYLVMNYVEGEDLTDRLGQPLPMQQVKEWLLGLCQTLSAIHGHGLIHRDLKPSNLRVTPNGELTVLDFGLVKEAGRGSSSLSESGAMIGTPLYLAPEQLDRSYGPIDVRTDIYSLGAIAYQMLTGSPPFSGHLSELFYQILTKPAEPPSECGALGDEFDAAVLKALTKKTEDRYQTVEEFAAALSGGVLS